MSVEPLSYLWKFGDGLTSTEVNSSHVYAMSGTYDWELAITFPGNNVLKITGIEYVYDNNYDIIVNPDGTITFLGLIISRTDKCLRFAIVGKLDQGIGWSEYDGNSWPYPVGRSGKCKIKDDNELFRNFVIDGNDFKVHELGIRNQWKDGETDYAGAEIESEILLKEETPPMGASAILQHEQSHAYVKPFDKEKRNVDDYNSEGFRSVFNMDAYIRVDSKITNAALTRKIPVKGQLVFDKTLKSPNLQIGWILRGAPWRFIKTQTWYRKIDSAAPPPDKLMSEMTWALELCGLSNWLARNILTPLMDSATGIEAAGSIAGTTTGPDGYTSALVLAAADSITISDVNLIGDFTMAIWLRSITTPLVLYTIGSFVVTITAAGVLNITDGINTVNIFLNSNFVSWTQLAITREGKIIRVYENGSLANTTILGSIEVVSGNLVVGGACTLSDLRIKTIAVSSDCVLYYNEDMLNNKGNSTCPII
jgi:PKD repeat protein